ncbi:MAG: Ig-like domain-containing protein [Gemmatimonadales bacterium]
MPDSRIRACRPDRHSLIGRASRATGLRPGSTLPLLAAIVLTLACNNPPTDSGGPPSEGSPDDITSLEIVAPPTLQVHEFALLSAQVLNRRGQRVFPSTIAWSSSDPSVASIATTGIVTASRRGTVTFTASVDTVSDTVTLRITAELRIQPDYLMDLPDGWPMAIGDHLLLAAAYVDVNGLPISEAPSLAWSSNDPAAVTVSPTGEVDAILAGHTVVVKASAPDAEVRVQVHVLNVVAGLPASLRIVHGIPGVDHIEFAVSQGSPVSLSFGESVELPILSGSLRVGADGLPPSNPIFGTPSDGFLGVIRPGDHLSLYAVGSPQVGFLQAVWPTTDAVAPDSVMVRLIQSSPMQVVYVRNHGARRTDLPELCYFDPGNVSQYFTRPSDFDIIGQNKYDQMEEVGRAAMTVPGGHAATMVVTGGWGLPVRVLSYTDR